MMMRISMGFVLIECKQESVKDITNQLDEISIVKETSNVNDLWRIITK